MHDKNGKELKAGDLVRIPVFNPKTNLCELGTAIGYIAEAFPQASSCELRVRPIAIARNDTQAFVDLASLLSANVICCTAKETELVHRPFAD